ncbi:MAG: hypothetical protein IPJ58_15805 [Ardenticatenia bacterium]|nr:hypothetical protein [Ardenticatenia bacterium]
MIHISFGLDEHVRSVLAVGGLCNKTRAALRCYIDAPTFQVNGSRKANDVKRSTVLIVIALVIVGTATTSIFERLRQGRGNGGTAGHDDIMLPRNVKQLIDASTIVIEGTVMSYTYSGAQQFNAAGPTLSPNQNAPSNQFLMPPSLVLDMSELSIRVDQVHFSRSPVVLESGDYITMLVPGNASTYQTPTPGDPNDRFGGGYQVRSEMVIPANGDSRLFILTHNPDRTTYGPVYGPYDVLDISDDDVTIQSSPPIVIDIADDANTTALMSEIQRIIQSQ